MCEVNTPAKVSRANHQHTPKDMARYVCMLAVRLPIELCTLKVAFGRFGREE